jgi:hypothetical protein
VALGVVLALLLAPSHGSVLLPRRSLRQEEQPPDAQQQASKGPDCPGADKWFPECWALALARVSAGNDRRACPGPPRPFERRPRWMLPAAAAPRRSPSVAPRRPLPRTSPTPFTAPPNRTLYWTPFTSKRWGNALSGYWAARALALLAGFGFDAYGAPGPGTRRFAIGRRARLPRLALRGWGRGGAPRRAGPTPRARAGTRRRPLGASRLRGGLLAGAAAQEGAALDVPRPCRVRGGLPRVRGRGVGAPAPLRRGVAGGARHDTAGDARCVRGVGRGAGQEAARAAAGGRRNPGGRGARGLRGLGFAGPRAHGVCGLGRPCTRAGPRGREGREGGARSRASGRSSMRRGPARPRRASRPRRAPTLPLPGPRRRRATQARCANDTLLSHPE